MPPSSLKRTFLRDLERILNAGLIFTVENYHEVVYDDRQLKYNSYQNQMKIEIVQNLNYLTFDFFQREQTF